MLLVKGNQLLCCRNVGVDRFIEGLLIYKLDRNSFHLHLRQFSEKSTMSLYGKFLGQLRSQTRADTRAPGEYFQIRRSGGGGGLDLTSSLEAIFGARSGQVHEMRGKIWEVLSPQDAKVGKKSQFWGSYLKFKGQNLGYLSLIFLEAKFGAPRRISEANF